MSKTMSKKKKAILLILVFLLGTGTAMSFWEFRIWLCQITNYTACIDAHPPADVQRKLQEDAAKKHGVNF